MHLSGYIIMCCMFIRLDLVFRMLTLIYVSDLCVCGEYRSFADCCFFLGVYLEECTFERTTRIL